MHRSALVMGMVAIVGCSGGATAKLDMSNNTSQAGATAKSAGIRLQDTTAPLATDPAVTLTRFAMRLSSVYLAEDVDPKTLNNVGNVQRIWTSPHCAREGDCELFDFARGSEAVNRELNSQDAEIDQGTYRYVRLEFCMGGPDKSHPNVEWQTAAMDAPHSFTVAMCGLTSARFDPPLTLGANDNVEVTLGYDLSSLVALGDVGPGSTPESPNLSAPDGHGIGYMDCAPDSTRTKKTCINIPTFTPSARKVK